MSESSESAFAGYRFHRVLASPGAFEATEVESGDAVVIESAVGRTATDPDLREWFAWAWGALLEVEHPNLPRVRRVSERDGVPFAVREPVRGIPATKLEDQGALGAQAVRILICRLADGLEEAHEAGVIHGSLGLEDVIVEADEESSRTDATGTLIGFGRAEGSRRGDIEDLGSVLEGLLEAESAAVAEVAAEQRSVDSDASTIAGEEDSPEAEKVGDDPHTPTERAILSMLARVAGEARAGAYRTAAELRDDVAAGSGGARRAPRRARGWLVAIVVVAVAALIVALLVGGGEDPEPEAPAPSPSQSTTAPVEIGAGVGAPIGTPGAPRGVSVRDGVVYVAAAELLGFDDPTGTEVLRPVELGEVGGELTVVAGVAWVTLPEADRLARVDVGGQGRPDPELIDVGAGPAAVIGAEGSIWVANERSGDLTKVDAESGEAEQVEIGATAPSGIAYGFDSLWVSDESGPLVRVDPTDPRRTRSYEVGENASAVLVTDDRVWVANAGSGTVTGLDPFSGATETIEVGGEPLDLAADPERLWVSNGDGYVSGISADSGEVERVDLAGRLGTPGSIAVGERVWVGAAGGDFLVPIG